MKLLNKRTVSVATTAATAASVFSVPAYAQTDASGGVSGGIGATAEAAPNTNTLPDIIQNVINVLLFIVGVAAVIMLIIGGIRYIVSSGDQQAVAGAKNTIIYSIVGLIVAVLAYAAVNFVFSTLTN